MKYALPLTLQSKFGRRIAFLFVISALLPMGVLAFVGYSQVRRQLVAESQVHLEQRVRDIGMGLLVRLQGARNALLDVADGNSLGLNPLGGKGGRRLAKELFSSLAVVRHGEPRVLWGEAPRLRLSPSESGRLHDGGRVLRVDDRGPQVWMVTLDRSGAQVWAAVAVEHLFRDIGANVGVSDARICVRVTAIRAPVYCSSVSGNEGPSLSTQWNAFLGYEFGAAPWNIEATLPMSIVLQPVQAFRNTFLLSILGVFALVVLLSSVQVRRSLQPLTALGAGTQRLARRDFSGTVEVRSGDEFEELAASFNRMTAEIDQHFRTMSAVGAIDQSALVERRAVAVAATAAGWLRDALGCAEVDILVAGDQRHSAWSRACTTNGAARIADTVLPDEADLERLLAARGQWSVVTGGFGWIGRAPGDVVVLLPLVSHDELIGAVAVHADQPLSEARLGIARQLADQLALGLSNVRFIGRLSDLSYGALAALARTIDANSPWTAGHSERVTTLSVRMGKRLGLPARDLDTVHRGALLHDIGKIGVPAEMLDGRGPLQHDERALMQRHPVIGADILTPITAFADAIPIVRYHHERLDGSGYPEGLTGEEIPFLARLIAVADVYDALVSSRPYRAGLSPADAVEAIRLGTGTNFDPVVVAAFLEVMAEEGHTVHAFIMGAQNVEVLQ